MEKWSFVLVFFFFVMLGLFGLCQWLFFVVYIFSGIGGVGLVSNERVVIWVLGFEFCVVAGWVVCRYHYAVFFSC